MKVAEFIAENAVVYLKRALEHGYKVAQPDVLGGPGQGETAAFAFNGLEYAVLVQFLQNFTEEGPGYPHGFLHLGHRDGGLIGAGHKDQRPGRIIHVPVYQIHVKIYDTRGVSFCQDPGQGPAFRISGFFCRIAYMKLTLYLVFLLLPGFCRADTFILKDGAKLEGEVTGEMDGALLVKTKYGSLTINKSDIQEQLPLAVPEIVAPAVAASTEAAIGISTALPEPVAAPVPELTFRTVLPSTMTRQLVYTQSGVAIATETFDAGGALLLAEGAIVDGTYTEYYPEGGLKTVKTMLSGKANGTLKAFFPSGALQIEAYYLAGAKEGPFKFYTEDGKLLLEAAYKNDKLNGWKKEYGPNGTAVSELYYADDQLSRPPNPQAALVPEMVKAAQPVPAEPESQVTVKVTRLARGELFSFRLNGKYIGKLRLDKEFNLISQEGKVPDGTVQVFSEDGGLQKELVFLKKVLVTLRVYEPGGPLKAEYSYVENKAVKK